ncbi:hypothetical protein [Rhodanobacter sp. MP1X3]|uniref:hypothetical protein n=1 Tax=Rhodanobacter sp. MP1X3 TaxID=2723086 RepID=UPI00161933A4|nr:hypothetical protein [Rhodanobacter sp. MP1X3]MBB6243402.1 hypothetical protein [Rhodanobacter sp. MP1X3]
MTDMRVANDAIANSKTTSHRGDLSSPVALNNSSFWLSVREFLSEKNVTASVQKNSEAIACPFDIALPLRT